jgi:hypothetical protein
LMVTRRALAITYLAIVTGAAFMYWLIWMRHPDYYVVQQEINLYPLQTIETLVRTETLPAVVPSFIGLGDLSQKATNLINVAQHLRAEKAQVSEDVKRLEREVSAASQILEENRRKRIDEYYNREVGPLLEKRAQLVRKIDELEKNTSTDPGSYRNAGISIAELRVQLAKLDYETSSKQLDVAERTLREYGQFAKAEDMGNWRQMEQQAEGAREALRILDNKWREHRMDAEKALGEWYSARIPKLTAIDFVYFSLGVSTTTTFGDIIPNHSIVRAIVVAQLLASLVIVGLFINSLWHDYGMWERSQPPNQTL